MLAAAHGPKHAACRPDLCAADGEIAGACSDVRVALSTGVATATQVAARDTRTLERVAQPAGAAGRASLRQFFGEFATALRMASSSESCEPEVAVGTAAGFAAGFVTGAGAAALRTGAMTTV